MAGNKRGVVDWTEAPDPTMRHNGAPTMVLHMKEGREWRERGAKGPGEGVVGVRNAILYRTREVNPPPRSLIPESLYVYLSVCSVTTMGFLRGFSSLKDHGRSEDWRRREENRKPTVPREETALDKEGVFALR